MGLLLGHTTLASEFFSLPPVLVARSYCLPKCRLAVRWRSPCALADTTEVSYHLGDVKCQKYVDYADTGCDTTAANVQESRSVVLPP